MSCRKERVYFSEHKSKRRKGDHRMTKKLTKTCLLGVVGIMAISLAACGDKTNSSSDTPANPSPSTKAVKRISKDDFTKAFSHKKIDGHTFVIQDNSQLRPVVDNLDKTLSQAKISPAGCDAALRQSSLGLTSHEISDTLVAVSDKPSTRIIATTAMSDRQKKAYKSQEEQTSKCGHTTLSTQGVNHGLEINIKASPIKGYENISKQAALFDVSIKRSTGTSDHGYQAYIWLNNDQAIRIFGRDAGIVKSTLQSATKALGIAKK